MIQRNRQPPSSRFRSRNGAVDFDRKHFDNSVRGNDFDRSEFKHSSEFDRSELKFDEEEFGHSSNKPRRDQQGRFEGVNRYGEGRILPDYYEDENGMRHAMTESNRHEFKWSRDPRSEASGESHYGKGPKGYQRRDESIREDVCDLLAHNYELDALDMEVSVREGIVTLDGTVKSRREKRLAEDLSDEIRGVKDVRNSLRVTKSMEGWVPGLGEVNNGEGPGALIKALKDKAN